MPHLDDLRQGHFRSDHIAFLDIFVAIFFIQNHDVRKRPDNQPLWLSAADSGTRAALRASRFALRRCRSAFSACFRRSVCRDIRALVSGIVSREERYAQGVIGGPQGCGFAANKRQILRRSEMTRMGWTGRAPAPTTAL